MQALTNACLPESLAALLQACYRAMLGSCTAAETGGMEAGDGSGLAAAAAFALAALAALPQPLQSSLGFQVLVQTLQKEAGSAGAVAASMLECAADSSQQQQMLHRLGLLLHVAEWQHAWQARVAGQGASSGAAAARHEQQQPGSSPGAPAADEAPSMQLFETTAGAAADSSVLGSLAQLVRPKAASPAATAPESAASGAEPDVSTTAEPAAAAAQEQEAAPAEQQAAEAAAAQRPGADGSLEEQCRQIVEGIQREEFGLGKLSCLTCVPRPC